MRAKLGRQVEIGSRGNNVLVVMSRTFFVITKLVPIEQMYCQFVYCEARYNCTIRLMNPRLGWGSVPMAKLPDMARASPIYLYRCYVSSRTLSVRTVLAPRSKSRAFRTFHQWKTCQRNGGGSDFGRYH